MPTLQVRARSARRSPIPAKGRTALLAAAIVCGGLAPALAQQEALEPVVNAESDRTLEYDWPIIKIGAAAYEEGPTGTTVFHFEEKVSVAVDVRGGGPGTVNAPYMDLGYDLAELDTIVFAGGSWYGLEAVTAVASALKDDGIRDGNAFSLEPNIAMSVGSIIFDFGPRRLNEIYPDKRLAQAAFRAAETGRFPQGAHGAGRFAKAGALFGCNAFSGQGGAFRQIGDVKIAAFTVANAYGVISDREGDVAACYEAESWPETVKVSDLMSQFPESAKDGWKGGDAGSPKNTTVSLVVVNQKMSPAELERLAVQVHTSMGRGIQPFATMFDGDVLYAVSTNELEKPVYSSPELGVLASEVMWDALLNSVPEQPEPATPAEGPVMAAEAVGALAGEYRFSQFVSVRFEADGQTLYARATGERPAYAIGKEERVALTPVAENRFMLPGRYPLTIQFKKDQVIFNPGHWRQTGARVSD